MLDSAARYKYVYSVHSRCIIWCMYFTSFCTSVYLRYCIIFIVHNISNFLNVSAANMTLGKVATPEYFSTRAVSRYASFNNNMQVEGHRGSGPLVEGLGANPFNLHVRPLKFLGTWALKGDGKFANVSVIPREGKERTLVCLFVRPLTLALVILLALHVRT